MISASEVGLVSLGGAVGATLRYSVGRIVDAVLTSPRFPVGTLLVNLIGCFLIGILAGASYREGISHQTKLLLVTGVLGGFTTFSAFGLETIELLQAARVVPAILYLFGSVVGGCAAVLVGLYVSGAPLPNR